MEASSLRKLDHNEMSEHIEFVDANPSSKLDLCEGDCDDDDDCKGNLVCFHREKDSMLAVPECEGGDEDGSRTDYCISPGETTARVGDVPEEEEEDLPSLEIEGDNPKKKLDVCEGDCDDDDNCDGDLVCFHREQFEMMDVPGCAGGDEDGSRTDYCVTKEELDEFEETYLLTSALRASGGVSKQSGFLSTSIVVGVSMMAILFS